MCVLEWLLFFFGVCCSFCFFFGVCVLLFFFVFFFGVRVVLVILSFFFFGVCVVVLIIGRECVVVRFLLIRCVCCGDFFFGVLNSTPHLLEKNMVFHSTILFTNFLKHQ